MTSTQVPNYEFEIEPIGPTFGIWLTGYSGRGISFVPTDTGVQLQTIEIYGATPYDGVSLIDNSRHTGITIGNYMAPFIFWGDFSQQIYTGFTYDDIKKLKAYCNSN